MKEQLKESLKFLVSKGTIITILAFTVTIGMHRIFENWAINYVVEPFLCKFTRNQYIDVILIFMLISSGIYGFTKNIKNYYKPSEKILWASFFVSIIYFIYRFFNTSVWCFEPICLWPALKYADLLLLYFAYQMLVFLAYKIQSFKKKDDTKKGFLIDTPTVIDNLNRQKYAKHIAQKLLDTKGDIAFAMGLVGHWGSGKTSFLNFIKEELKNKAIIVAFNPWLSENPKLIIRDFFDALKSELADYDGSIASDISDYSQKLTEIDDNIFTKTLNALKPTKSVFKEYEDVKKSIEQLHKPLVVLIDDIDRLDKKEVIEVLRLVRNTANFGNMSYVVAYDRNYVVEAIAELNPHNKEQYLEKIFQLEVTLPVYEKVILKQQLEERLLECIEAEYHDEFKRILKLSFVLDFMGNLRDTFRFVNGFILSFELLKENIEIQDLFVLELIKFKYPTLYQALGKHKWILEHKYTIAINKSNTTKLADEILDNVRKYENDTIKQKLLIAAFENLCSEYLYEKDLLHRFSENNNPKKSNLSIIHASKHDRYFAFRLMQGDISEIEFGNLRTSLNREELAKQFVKWHETSWSDLNDKIENNLGFDNTEDHQKMAYASFQAFRNDGHRHFWIRDNFFNLNKKNINALYSDKKILANFIIEICVKNAQYPYDWEFCTLQYLKSQQENWKPIMSDKELEKNQSILFKKLIEGKEKIKDMTLLIYACWSGEHELMINYVEQNMINFFVAIIKESPPKYFSVKHDDGIECIWKLSNLHRYNFDSFDAYIMGNKPPHSEALDEFRDFWKKFKSHKYEHPINFNFTHIPVNTIQNL
jgi:KAP family P-loop domain